METVKRAKLYSDHPQASIKEGISDSCGFTVEGTLISLNGQALKLERGEGPIR